MGLFSFTQGVAIDLGTANTIITINDKIVVDEPSVVALDARIRIKCWRSVRSLVRCTRRHIRISARSVRCVRA